MVRFTVKVASNRDMNAKLRLIHRGVAVAEQSIQLKAKEETVCHAEVRMVTSGDTVWDAELVPELRNKRLGLSDTVYAQIQRYNEAARRHQRRPRAVSRRADDPAP